LKRIQSHKGVVGIVVINNEGRLKVSILDLQLLLLIFINPTGIPIKSTLDNATTVQYAGLVSQLADKARSVVRELDPTNDMTFFRLRSKKHEVHFCYIFFNEFFKQNLFPLSRLWLHQVHHLIYIYSNFDCVHVLLFFFIFQIRSIC